MNCGDWITLIAVIVALTIGVASFIQMNHIQQSERKQRLLKEIEDWAKEVIYLISELERSEERSLEKFRFNTEQRWRVLKATTANMKNIADKIDKEFGVKVNQAVINFNYLWEGIQPGGALKSNIYDRLQGCKDSCTTVLESTGLLKFSEIR